MRLAGLAALVPLAMLIGIAFGGAALAPDALANALLHPAAAGDAATIVWQLRIPRVAIAATVGASLALVAVSAIGVIVGSVLSQYLPLEWIKRVAGAAFIVIGVLILIGRF